MPITSRFRSSLRRIVCVLLVMGMAQEAGASPLERVARVGPWPAIAGLIGYRGSVWFVNSVKFENHNSADVHRFDPDSGEVVFEKHLFTQDAGDPLVVDGLLIWPFEDSRFSASRAEYMVTDGTGWQWRAVPAVPAFHNHTMVAHGAHLYAAVSAWKARLVRADRTGAGWTQIYVHPTPSRRVSRITSLAVLGQDLHAGLTSLTQPGIKLLRLNVDTLEPVKGWPSGSSTTTLHAHAGWLYGINDGNDSSRLWRTDGQRAEAVEALDGRVVRDFASAAGSLWAVSGTRGRGALLRSSDGQRWRVVHEFGHAVPLDLLVYGGAVFVGAMGGDGKGELWADLSSWSAPMRHLRARLPDPHPEPVTAGVTGLLEALDAALHGSWDDFSTYRRSILPVLESLSQIRSTEVGDALSRRLMQDAGRGELSAIGGNITARVQSFNRWYLLRTLGLSAHGHVAPALLQGAWETPANPAAKYIDPLPGAAFVAGVLAHHDDRVLARLVSAMDDPGQPLWLRGDITGALHALTGREHGYDREAWRAWWAQRQSMIAIDAGSFAMGSDSGEDAEAPVHTVHVSRFHIDRHEITNGQFGRFVDDTAHQSDVQRKGWGWHWAGRWGEIPGASWRQPRGPGSDIAGLEHHPVVQVSWNDARAYCAWAGKRLPTEAEWEFATRTQQGRTYAWGDSVPHEGETTRAASGARTCCRADEADGFLYTAPVGSFPAGASAHGVHDLTGNVWEWVRDSFDAQYYRRSPDSDPLNLEPAEQKVIRGGGWGNNPWGLRATLRHANRPDHGLSMVGFRCAR